METIRTDENANIDNFKAKYLLERLIDIEIDNLLLCKSKIDIEQVSTLIQEILDAPQVIIIGSRASDILVSYASYIFNKIGISTLGFDASDSKALDTIKNQDRTALVIAFGFHRYPRATIVITRYLKTRGFKVVSITDSEKSPLVELSDYAFNLNAHSYEFTDSYSSAMILINLIATLISRINRNDVSRRLKDFDETAHMLDYYL